MAKTDLKTTLKQLYQPSTKAFDVVDVPPMSFLMIEGSGDPNQSQEYQDAVQVLYNLSYTLKFMLKKEQGVDYAVMPLEGLWWADGMDAFVMDRRANWEWTSMIMQPEWVTPEAFDRALRQLREKKQLPALEKVRLEAYHEGLSVQIMHVGPFSTEGPVLERMHQSFIPENGYREAGKHHEIYLSDFRKTAPEKLKTVLRQPVANIIP
jgi:hypothetical protein